MTENELKWFEEIIREAQAKVEPKYPTITDVLRSYDEFISIPIITLFLPRFRSKRDQFNLPICSDYL